MTFQLTPMGMVCAACGLAGAALVHVIYRCSDAMQRRGWVDDSSAVSFTVFGLMVGLLWVSLVQLYKEYPTLTAPIAPATITGFVIGQLLPRPGRGQPKDH